MVQGKTNLAQCLHAGGRQFLKKELQPRVHVVHRRRVKTNQGSGQSSSQSAKMYRAGEIARQRRIRQGPGQKRVNLSFTVQVYGRVLHRAIN